MLSTNLPYDLMEEIMVRLPVKSLLHFKCVAKSWYALITDHYFITKHFERSNSMNKKYRLMLVYNMFAHNDVPPNISLISIREQPYEIQRIELPFPKNNLKSMFIYGQCNGIFCLLGDYEDVRLLFLWNPATKEVKTIPTSQWQPEGLHYSKYGFGFDSITKDYKVVQIPVNNFEQPLVQLYNLSTDSWSKLDVDVSIFTSCLSIMGPYLNGAYHWLTSTHDDIDMFVTSFNFSKEAFGIIRGPPSIIFTSSFTEDNLLTKVDESLAWTSMHVTIEVCLEIWVMNEYDVESSWTKKFKICPFPFSYSWYVVQFWRDNEIIVYDDNYCQLISYNLHDDRRERLQDHFRTMMMYVESLFPLGRKGN